MTAKLFYRIRVSCVPYRRQVINGRKYRDTETRIFKIIVIAYSVSLCLHVLF